MNFEFPKNDKFEKKETPKEIFMKTLEEELKKLIQQERITPEDAEGTKKAASLIEEGIDENPEHKAKMFSVIRIAGEDEITKLFKEESFLRADVSKENIGDQSRENTEEEKAPKEIFMETLDEELEKLMLQGRITSEEAKNTRKLADLIEEGIEDDPEHKAKIFSVARVANEKELTELLGNKLN